jgi:hypothetical protein
MESSLMKILVALMLSACSGTVLAGLGSSAVALEPGVLSASSTLMSTVSSTYTKLQKTLESGTQVHEYVNAGGTVFAVSWSGPYMPDLKGLLGAHFQALLDNARKQPGAARSQVDVQQDDVVIFSGGRVGAFEGKAWIPALLPAGFSTSDIK